MPTHATPRHTATSSRSLPCVKQVQRNLNRRHFHPRWKPKCLVTKKCNIENCQALVYTNTSLASVDEIETFLQERVHGFTTDGSRESIALCKEHYDRMYLHLHPKACDSCGARPRKSEVFNRHCPSPDIVNSHLHHIAAEKSNLSASSIICISCYKYFQSILKQPIATSASCEPSDLDSVSTSLAQKVEDLRSKGQNISREEYFEMVLYQTAQILLAAMKSDEALLLSTLYNMYIGTNKAESQNYPSLILTPDIHTPHRRWVLSRLHALFGESLTIVCKHYKYGTLLFHSRCDLVKALSTALGKGANTPAYRLIHQQMNQRLVLEVRACIHR